MAPIPLLILDPERAFAGAFRADLSGEGFQVKEVRSGEAAMEAAELLLPSIVIKPALERDRDKNTRGLMERLQGLCPDIQFIFVSDQTDVRMAMRAMRRGAFDCLPLPCERGQLLESIQRALENQRLVAEHPEILSRLQPRQSLNVLTGQSPALRQVQEIVTRVADTDVTVLISGESGTGKELIARLLHERSRRAEGPFIAVNCAALPDSLIESELFGHVRGAFTGAVADKPGRFTLASRGTLFLDEIGDLSPMGQADLLRVLEDGIYRPIGSDRTRIANTRILAATNRNLEDLCREGKFREDLLYRLNVISISIPALRDRPEDIPLLAQSFVGHFCARHRRPLKILSSRLLTEITHLPWPGNVRQLRNVIERMVLLVPARHLLPEHLPEYLRPQEPAACDPPPLEEMTLAEAEKELIHRAIQRCRGNKSEAARRLGISRRKLYDRTPGSASG